VLPRSFLDRPASVVAPELLGVLLVAGGSAVRLVEVEAYESDDPASHSFIGPRPRTQVMFGPPGHLYVYRSYGLHWCANVVCDADGTGAAVLLRAGEPVWGEEAIRRRRPGIERASQLCAGPGRLCQALGITDLHRGVDLTDPASPVRLEVPDGDRGGGCRPAGAEGIAGTAPVLRSIDGRPQWSPVAGRVVRTTRIGLTKGVEVAHRWLEAGNPHVSRPPRAVRPPRPVGPARPPGDLPRRSGR
jgi:DNA-3-methyladenine glycosylase